MLALLYSVLYKSFWTPAVLYALFSRHRQYYSNISTWLNFQIILLIQITYNQYDSICIYDYAFLSRIYFCMIASQETNLFKSNYLIRNAPSSWFVADFWLLYIQFSQSTTERFWGCTEISKCLQHNEILTGLRKRKHMSCSGAYWIFLSKHLSCLQSRSIKSNFPVACHPFYHLPPKVQAARVGAILTS